MNAPQLAENNVSSGVYPRMQKFSQNELDELRKKTSQRLGTGGLIRSTAPLGSKHRMVQNRSFVLKGGLSQRGMSVTHIDELDDEHLADDADNVLLPAQQKRSKKLELKYMTEAEVDHHEPAHHLATNHPLNSNTVATDKEEQKSANQQNNEDFEE